MNPFSLWTELAFKLWGFGKPAASSDTSEKKVAVAVIPTTDAQSPPPAKRAKGKAHKKRKAKRARR